MVLGLKHEQGGFEERPRVHLRQDQNGLDTGCKIDDDGRVGCGTRPRGLNYPSGERHGLHEGGKTTQCDFIDASIALWSVVSKDGIGTSVPALALTALCKPARQPEAVAASFEGKRNPGDRAPGPEEAGLEPSVPRKTPAVVVISGLAAPPSPLRQGEPTRAPLSKPWSTVRSGLFQR